MPGKVSSFAHPQPDAVLEQPFSQIDSTRVLPLFFPEVIDIAIIGGGPAGLRAAEVAAQSGAKVTLFDVKPSVGRKFLVAGRGGLNITKAEPVERFVTRYAGGPPELWIELIQEFSPDTLREWAAGLGIETFEASTGRVYPREMKAAPLLRRWVARLRELGVEFAMNHHWSAIQPGEPHLLTFRVGNDSTRQIPARAVIFALGGASWPHTGSNGAWTKAFEGLGIQVSPLQPANCGWEIAWPEIVRSVEGQPLKNIVVKAGDCEAAGELMITAYGLEGGAIYQLGPALRGMDQAAITIDFKPSFTAKQLVAKLGGAKQHFLEEAVKRWRLSNAAAAILASHGPYPSGDALAQEAKASKITLLRPRPIAEAISSAGGVHWSDIDRSLMLHNLPGVFVAGEMIDWEAPTGGYLIQGCFATGTRAGRSSLAWLKERGQSNASR